MLITLPLAVPVTKGGRLWQLNLNQYRNTHYQTLNKAKSAFKEAIEDQLKALPFLERIAITYTLFPKNAQLCDTSNVCAIQDKFFCDALKECKRIADDNYKIVLGTQYLFGAIDRQNPRVEARIHHHPRE